MLACLDFDGVIADSLSQQLEVVRRAQSRVGCGRKPEIADFHACENLNYLSFGERIGIPSSAMAQWKFQIEQELAGVSDAAFFPGIAQALQDVASFSKLAVITSNLSSVVERGFAAIGAPCPAVYDLTYSLDKTAKIFAAASDLGERPETSVMVGDTRGDIRHGKAANAKTIAVAWGYHTPETLALESPDFVVATPAELAALLRRLNHQ